MIELAQPLAQVYAARRLEILRQRINDENYLHAAIQRLALVLSNEIMEITTEGGRNERKRKRRKQPQEQTAILWSER